MRPARLSVSVLAMALVFGAVRPVLAQAPMPEACQRQQQTGAIGGGLLGALAGGVIAGRHNRAGGAVLGGVIGAIAGSQVAKHLSDCGRAMARRAAIAAAETNAPQMTVAPDTHQHITATPGPAVVTETGAVCKSVAITVDDGSPSSQAEDRSTLCRGADGHWR
jgi:hypothetical protein